MFCVIARGSQRVLVIGLDWRAGCGEDSAKAPPYDDFGVGQMSEDFSDGPFTERGTLAQFGCR